MKISGIYQIQSKTKPDRVYIGSAINISRRWLFHLYQLRHNQHHSSKLQNHFNKYGEVDLQFSVLFCCEDGGLISIEQLFLDLCNPYFNICKLAGSCIGRKHSKESIEKMCKPRSQEFKDKMRSIRLGIFPSDETRYKQSISAKKRKPNRKGVKLSEAVRLAMSERTKKQWENKRSKNE